MAVICRERKLLYLLNPRTGGSAVANHLIKYFNGEWIPAQDILDSNGTILLQSKHQQLSKLYEFSVLKPDELKEYVIFTNVRDPYDSLVSLYEKYKGRYAQWKDEGNYWVNNSSSHILNEIEYCSKHSFSEWICSRYWKSALLSVLGLRKFSIHTGYPDGCNKILRKEHLSADFSSMLAEYKVDGNPSIEVYNQTETKKGKSGNSYNFFTRALVYLTYKDDFINYGYPS